MRLARLQGGGEQVAVAVEDQQRQVDALVVKGVEGRELLLAVGRVVGGIQVEDEASAGALGVANEVRVERSTTEPVAGLGASGVFHARERGLAGQVGIGDGVAAATGFQDRIAPQRGGVVAVGIAQRDAEDALAEHVLQRLVYVPPVALVGQCDDEPRDQGQSLVEPTQQQRTAVAGEDPGRLETRTYAVEARIVRDRTTAEKRLEVIATRAALGERVRAKSEVIMQGSQGKELRASEAPVWGDGPISREIGMARRERALTEMVEASLARVALRRTPEVGAK